MRNPGKALVIRIALFLSVGIVFAISCQPAPTPTPTPTLIPTPIKVYENEELQFCGKCHQDQVEEMPAGKQRHPYIGCTTCHPFHLAKEKETKCKAGFGIDYSKCLGCHQELFN
jgi:hypothetical protein